jgi:hypothetical protein
MLEAMKLIWGTFCMGIILLVLIGTPNEIAQAVFFKVKKMYEEENPK